MSKIIIRGKSGSKDCDDCGYYDTEYVKVEYEGKILELTYSGHFGDGNFDPYDKFDMTVKILNFLGFNDVSAIESGAGDEHNSRAEGEESGHTKAD